MRLVERQFLALLFQLPPRSTRFDPVFVCHRIFPPLSFLPRPCSFCALWLTPDRAHKGRGRQKTHLLISILFFLFSFLFLHLLIGSNLKKQDQAKAIVVAAAVRKAVAAISGTAVTGIAAPTATAQHTVRPSRRSYRVSLR